MAAAQSVGVALPVDDEPGTPGIVVLWPDEGCSDCVRTPQLVSAYEEARDAILKGDSATLAKLHPRIVRIISYSEKGGTGSYDSRDVPLAELGSQLKGCTPTAQGQLPSTPRSSLTPFGIGADCPGKEGRAFMSLGFEGTNLATVFLMPDRPLLVRMEPQKSMPSQE